MTQEQFSEQMERVRGEYGDRYYGKERTRLLWKMFCKDRSEDFENTISKLIVDYKWPPMGKEFEKAMQHERNVSAQQRSQDQQISIAGIMQGAYDPAQYSDPQVRERIKGRIKLVADLNKMTKKQFEEGCEFYDKLAKFPPKYSCT